MDDESSDVIPCIQDLMYEHSILVRILLIFEELIKKDIIFLENHNFRYINLLTKIIKIYIENHHEKMEEKYIFPQIRFNKKIVTNLIIQHRLSNIITNKLILLTLNKHIYLKNINKIIELLKLYITLYRKHENIENTEIFPEFLKNISKEKYKKYGEEMEKHEKKILKNLKVKHFIKFIEYVEKQLNISNISLFTNKIIKGITDL